MLLALGATCAGAAPPPPPLPAAASLRQEALALAARDDSASMERSVQLLGEVANLDPRLYPARADRALVAFLVAAARRDEAARLPDGEALARSGWALREQSLDEMRPLVKQHPRDPAVARALAIYYGLDGRGAETAAFATLARAAGESDAWVDFAELAAGLRDASPEAAASRLAEFADSHPGLLRARMMLARAELDAGRPDAALATLDAILAENPDHDLAGDLKARLLAPPPARIEVVPAPLDAPPPRPPGHLPRKPSTGGDR